MSRPRSSSNRSLNRPSGAAGLPQGHVEARILNNLIPVDGQSLSPYSLGGEMNGPYPSPGMYLPSSRPRSRTGGERNTSGGSEQSAASFHTANSTPNLSSSRVQDHGYPAFTSTYDDIEGMRYSTFHSPKLPRDPIDRKYNISEQQNLLAGQLEDPMTNVASQRQNQVKIPHDENSSHSSPVTPLVANNPQEWSLERVLLWLDSNNFGAEVQDAFRDHNIYGERFLNLVSYPQVRKILPTASGAEAGVASRLCNAVRKVRERPSSSLQQHSAGPEISHASASRALRSNTLPYPLASDNAQESSNIDRPVDVQHLLNRRDWQNVAPQNRPTSLVYEDRSRRFQSSVSDSLPFGAPIGHYHPSMSSYRANTHQSAANRTTPQRQASGLFRRKHQKTNSSESLPQIGNQEPHRKSSPSPPVSVKPPKIGHATNTTSSRFLRKFRRRERDRDLEGQGYDITTRKLPPHQSVDNLPIESPTSPTPAFPLPPSAVLSSAKTESGNTSDYLAEFSSSKPSPSADPSPTDNQTLSRKPVAHIPQPPSKRLLVQVTNDNENYKAVDLTHVSSPANMKALIIRKLALSSRSPPFFYLTEIGGAEHTVPLDNEGFAKACEEGDVKGTLKFYVELEKTKLPYRSESGSDGGQFQSTPSHMYGTVTAQDGDQRLTPASESADYFAGSFVVPEDQSQNEASRQSEIDELRYMFEHNFGQDRPDTALRDPSETLAGSSSTQEGPSTQESFRILPEAKKPVVDFDKPRASPYIPEDVKRLTSAGLLGSKLERMHSDLVAHRVAPPPPPESGKVAAKSSRSHVRDEQNGLIKDRPSLVSDHRAGDAGKNRSGRASPVQSSRHHIERKPVGSTPMNEKELPSTGEDTGHSPLITVSQFSYPQHFKEQPDDNVPYRHYPPIREPPPIPAKIDLSRENSPVRTAAKPFPKSGEDDLTLLNDAPDFEESGSEDGDEEDGEGLWAIRPSSFDSSPLSRPQHLFKGEDIVPNDLLSSSTDVSEHDASEHYLRSSSTGKRRNDNPRDPSREKDTRTPARRNSFIANRDVWAIRPPANVVYENIEEYFPGYDLDKPILDPSKTLAINSPTALAVPLATPTVATQKGGGMSRNLHRGQPGLNRRKTLRHAFKEASDKEKRKRSVTRKVQSNDSSLLRRKSTKMFGSRLVEMTPAEVRRAQSPTNESLMKHRIKEQQEFQWAKGELIGQGTYGKVYLALNVTTSEMLAMKQVDVPKIMGDPNDAMKATVNALYLEIETMKDLDHENIVQYLGWHQNDAEGYICIFLEYVPGGSVGRCLRKHGKFDFNLIQSLTRQTLEGLAYLHGRDILHRDLKADNLLLDLDGTCKISDFGISKRSESAYGDNDNMTMQGSIFWMAPEVIQNQRQGYNAKIDIWSLGCVVLEMFAGRRPWSNDEAIGAMFKLGNERRAPPVPEDVKPALTAIAEDFLSQCFTIDPSQRPTAADLLNHPFCELDQNFDFSRCALSKSIRFCP